MDEAAKEPRVNDGGRNSDIGSEAGVSVKPEVDDEGGAEGIEVDWVELKKMPLCVEVVAEAWMKLKGTTCQ